jgi:glycosyltransferase involved in cell wall biosynthesis
MPTADLSVILANYNHARLLPRALDAILAQSVRPREIVLLDDGSTDDSMAVLEGYARREPAIRLFRNGQNMGVCATYNKGLTLATTEWSLLAAADDYLLPRFLEKTLAQLEWHPHAGLCFAYDSFQEGGGPVWPNASGWTDAPGYFTPDDVCRLLRHCLPGHATVIRRQALIDAGGYRPELAWYSDWFALLTVAFRSGVCHVPATLAVRVMMLPGAYSAGAKQGPRNVAVLAAFLDHITSPEYADVAPYFRRNGAATFFGTDLIRAAAPRPDRWEPHVLGFLNGFTTEKYEELLLDPDPAVRELAGFFLGPFWRESVARRKELEAEIERLRRELEATRQRIPPPGAVGKLRWLAGLVTKRLRRAG